MKCCFLNCFFAILIVAGCGQPNSVQLPTSDTQSDLEHQHKHFHTNDQDHDHGHADFEGAHSHGHEHGHRHAEPPHGGEIVAIEYADFRKAIVHYHAEVMPLQEQQIRFYLLAETHDGGWEEHPIKQRSIDALVHKASENAQEMQFLRNEGDFGSTFSAKVPDKLNGDDSLLVSVHGVVIDDVPMNFEFTVAPPSDPVSQNSFSPIEPPLK